MKPHLRDDRSHAARRRRCPARPPQRPAPLDRGPFAGRYRLPRGHHGVRARSCPCCSPRSRSRSSSAAGRRSGSSASASSRRARGTRSTDSSAPRRRSTARSSRRSSRSSIATPLALGVSLFLSEFAPRWLRQPVALPRRPARRDPERRLRALGDLRAAPAAARPGHALPARHAASRARPASSRGRPTGPACWRRGSSSRSWCSRTSRRCRARCCMAVPRSQREAALALGATRWEMIRDAVAPVRALGDRRRGDPRTRPRAG